jgi:hypothetical protein
MRVDEKFVIELSFDEAVALKKILGAESANTEKEKGLDVNQSEKMSQLFLSLPCQDQPPSTRKGKYAQ